MLQVVSPGEGETAGQPPPGEPALGSPRKAAGTMAPESERGRRDGQGLAQTHGSGCPHRSRPRSRLPRRTPRAWRCSGGCCTRTARGSRTCLGEEERRGQSSGDAGGTTRQQSPDTALTGAAPQGWCGVPRAGAGDAPQFLSTVRGLFRELGTKTVTQVSRNWPPSIRPRTHTHVLSEPTQQDICVGHSYKPQLVQ